MQRASLVALAFAGALSPAVRAQDIPASFGGRVAPGYEAIAQDLAARVRYDLVDKGIPGVVLAAQDGDDLVLEGGFGVSTPAGGASMPADAVFRCASISKLFTATVVHQLAGESKLDLDAPVRLLLPEFAAENPFDTAVTLRHILGHRSGIVREPPVGHYFDTTEPSLKDMVVSLAHTALVTEPGTTYAYSNAALGVAGRVVEVLEGKPFPQVVAERVLKPLGMERSSFDSWGRTDVAGAMWTYDRRSIPCPTFDFAYGPASNLQGPMGDLMLFARSLFRGKHQAGHQLLEDGGLQAMWEPPAGSSCGQGFRVDTRLGTRRLSHGGAVYGFATILYILPDEGLAVAVGSTLDMSNAVVSSIADRALRHLLAKRKGASLPAEPRAQPLGREVARRMAGRFESATDRVDLRARGDELYAMRWGGTRWRIRSRNGELVTDGPMSVGAKVAGAGWNGSEPDILKLGGRQWHRQSEPVPGPGAAPEPPPKDLVPLLGEYGWDHNRMIVLEDRGQLAVLIEWLVLCPLARTDDPNVFRMEPKSMYAGEAVVFERDGDGQCVSARVGGCVFPRVASYEADTSFRIDPRHDAASLRRMAAQARAPRPPKGSLEADLVELSELDGTIRYDIRYATTNNFMGTPFYEVARARLQRPAAAALVAANGVLRDTYGVGVIAYDGYRPWSVTKMFYDATPNEQRIYVADPKNGSRHNRGCAIDLGLFDVATGEVVGMVSGYDEFTPKASPDYVGSTTRRRWFRERLREVMEDQGFEVYDHEWWHFDFRDWQRYPVLNEPLK